LLATALVVMFIIWLTVWLTSRMRKLAKLVRRRKLDRELARHVAATSASYVQDNEILASPAPDPRKAEQRTAMAQGLMVGLSFAAMFLFLDLTGPGEFEWRDIVFRPLLLAFVAGGGGLVYYLFFWFTLRLTRALAEPVNLASTVHVTQSLTADR